jgi:hypothetical protein
MAVGFATLCSLARPGRPRYPVLVHRAAVLLCASFRPRLTTMPLRFANPSPPSGWIEDFHLQAVDHARHTIGIGGSLTTPPLPHHRTYGSRIRRFGGLSGHLLPQKGWPPRFGNPQPRKRFGPCFAVLSGFTVQRRRAGRTLPLVCRVASSSRARLLPASIRSGLRSDGSAYYALC